MKHLIHFAVEIYWSGFELDIDVDVSRFDSVRLWPTIYDYYTCEMIDVLVDSLKKWGQESWSIRR